MATAAQYVAHPIAAISYFITTPIDCYRTCVCRKISICYLLLLLVIFTTLFSLKFFTLFYMWVRQCHILFSYLNILCLHVSETFSHRSLKCANNDPTILLFSGWLFHCFSKALQQALVTFNVSRGEIAALISE